MLNIFKKKLFKDIVIRSTLSEKAYNRNKYKDNMIVFGGSGTGQARSIILPPSKEELKKLKEKAESAINIDDFEYLGEYIEKKPIEHFVKVYKDKEGKMYKMSEYLNEEEYLKRLKKYHFDEYVNLKF